MRVRRSDFLRRLRSYERVAEKEYRSCYKCELSIFPGDRYTAEVFVQFRKIWITRCHIGCPIDPEHGREESEGEIEEQNQISHVA